MNMMKNKKIKSKGKKKQRFQADVYIRVKKIFFKNTRI